MSTATINLLFFRYSNNARMHPSPLTAIQVDRPRISRAPGIASLGQEAYLSRFNTGMSYRPSPV